MKPFLLFIFLTLSGTIFAQQQALSQLVYEIRDPATDSAHFRQALEKIGEYLALSVLDKLNTSETTVLTLTGKEATHQLVNETPVLVTIMRAGLPLNYGVQRVFPHAKVGFFAMSRNEETLKAKVDYIALPMMKNKVVIISDTMIGTGGSMLDAIQEIEQYEPKKIYVISAIASQPGIDRILQHNSQIEILAGVVDPSLNDKGYILPGLGDAGDRCFGEKDSRHD